MIIRRVLSDLVWALRRAVADLIDPSRVHQRDQRRQHRRAEQARAFALLHRLWSKGKDGPDYVKDEWNEFAALLAQLGVQSRIASEPNGDVASSSRRSHPNRVRVASTDELDPFPARTPLPEDLIRRVKVLHQKLSDVYDQRLESWIEGFERDANPASEIGWWEWLVSSFECVLVRAGITPEHRKEAFVLASKIALGASPAEISHASKLLPSGTVEVVRDCMNRTHDDPRRSG